MTCIIATHDSTDALSFSDETIVVQNGRVVAKGDSKTLYENPTTKYIASLFGEVNELRLTQLIDIEPEEDQLLLLYPHQLKVVDNSMMQVVVKQCYFKGSHYLVKAAFERKTWTLEIIKKYSLSTFLRIDLVPKVSEEYFP